MMKTGECIEYWKFLQSGKEPETVFRPHRTNSGGVRHNYNCGWLWFDFIPVS